MVRGLVHLSNQLELFFFVPGRHIWLARQAPEIISPRWGLPSFTGFFLRLRSAGHGRFFYRSIGRSPTFSSWTIGVGLWGYLIGASVVRGREHERESFISTQARYILAQEKKRLSLVPSG